MRVALLIALAPALFAAGRLELFHAPSGGAETPVAGIIDLASAPVSDSVSVRFRIRNVGDGPVTLTTFHVKGVGFSSMGAPSLPHIVAAGTNVDFTVRFSPPDYGSYSALLTVNSTTYVVRALGEAAVAVFHDGRVLAAGDTVDFGRMERGSTLKKTFEFRNTTAQPLGVGRSTLTGPQFFFPAGTPTPYLQPGDAVGFEVEFRATTSGVYKERLIIDRREFWLTATAFDPPLPRPTVVIESGAIRSGEQGRVSVRLAQRAGVKAKGTIRLEFQPSGEAKDNDTAMRFTTGARSVDFDIAEGDTVVRFGSQEALTFQAGTTTGTIVFTVEAGGFTDRASVVVAPEAVRLEKSSATRTTSSIDVRLTGFDNTRTLSGMSFTFYAANGQPLAGMPMRVPVVNAFSRWWTESKLGGVFGFHASFPVTGDISQIRAVEVEIENSSGNTRTERLTF